VINIFGPCLFVTPSSNNTAIAPRGNFW